MSDVIRETETTSRRPFRLAKALPIGIGLVASLTLVSSILLALSDPAISGYVWLAQGCPGDHGDLTGSVVTVTSSSGQVETAQLGPPIPGVAVGFQMGLPTCSYRFEIQDRIPGATLTFEVLGCSATYASEHLRDHAPSIRISPCGFNSGALR